MSETEDDIIAKLSDYLDGEGTTDERAAIASKLEHDDEWKRIHADLVETRNDVETRKHLSGIQRARAPETFASEVTSTIHQRSAGRFFARRTFGDRVPFGALLVVAVLVLAVIGYVMWSSQTGSLKVNHSGSGGGSNIELVPKP